jgi:uncharacterized protein (TIGR03790 family)
MRLTAIHLLRFTVVLASVTFANRSWAGGGPENVLVVVNGHSIGSKTIANHYIALRNIPASNVLYIDWRGGLEGCQGVQFSGKLLQPIIEAIANRKLSAQIDCVTYSSDFPWLVNLQSLFPEEKFPPQGRPMASINSATYLWQYVRDKNPAIVLPVVNWYAAGGGGNNYAQCTQLGKVDSRAFRSSYFWNAQGGKTKARDKGQNYLLSTVLGVTTGRGNSTDEILSYLKRSVEVDGTKPRGTFYYMKNSDVRSKTRHDCFDSAVQQLTRIGVPAIVENGTIPYGSREVMGILTGARTFDFASSGSTLLPGSICDNLTSLGGVLKADAGQTPLTEFLRYGASGASGTVAEPLAIQAKFPLASLFLHYARGCSLAESYYQSVAGPYMLLVVGDPLCQPFAVFPKVEVEGIKPGQTVKGTLTIKAVASTVPLMRIGSLELFVDGRIVARFAPGQSPQLDTTKLPDGYHELRVVAVNSDAIESRGRVVLPIIVDNRGGSVELSASPQAGVTATDVVKFSVRQPGATSIAIRQNGRQIAQIKGEAGDASVLAATLGRGPVMLTAESQGPNPAISEPLRIEIN